jgi:hypothetical protein
MAHTLTSSNVSGGPKAEKGLDQASQTCFSTCDFAEAWARSFDGEYQTFAIPVRESGPPRTMYAVQNHGSYGRQFLSLAPYGLYASPGWQGQLQQSTLEGILGCLTGIQTISFVWNVRFDHEQLAGCLISSGLEFSRTPTRVLNLTSDYERTFAGYNATIRNHVRKAPRRGVSVRQTVSPESVAEYHRIYTRNAERRGGYGVIYPAKLLLELVEARSIARLLVAEHEGRLIGGGLFFRDGNSIRYWHGASDREYSHCYPSCAVLDEAIRWACESGAAFFNFGPSVGLSSLDQFKSFWGARTELNWEFVWTNPLWARVSSLKTRLTSNLCQTN